MALGAGWPLLRASEASCSGPRGGGGGVDGEGGGDGEGDGVGGGGAGASGGTDGGLDSHLTAAEQSQSWRSSSVSPTQWDAQGTLTHDCTPPLCVASME